MEKNSKKEKKPNKNLVKILNNSQKVRAWYRAGKTVEEIAKELGISSASMYYYKSINEDVGYLFEEDGDTTKFSIEEAFLDLLKPTKQKVKKPIKMKNTERDPITGRITSEEEYIAYADEEIIVQPPPRLIEFALCNLYPERYSQKVEAKGDINNEFIVQLTKDN
ncbi:MAG: hypothetical protein R3Y18_00125 [Bacillota bacterium]